jgi:hypothetical protein
MLGFVCAETWQLIMIDGPNTRNIFFMFVIFCKNEFITDLTEAGKYLI